ncbi:DUF7282 domain-containing protein [Wenxinia saemankumensis]|uniref:DUF7282 domain-containing protein n=1 Tax=Wenxinia saemankumensis TaxID=1447782 RepID=A0A1M6E882_9RHOB|nr:hypothetical protein [Wenxinia saemankumensis]SHI81707.1 hypothetical protein SAMN05444417_1866 [Wenxinia saemankumensis]
MRMRHMMTATALTALMAGGAMAQDDATDNTMMMEGMTPSGTTVTFPAINVAQDGYIVIHETDADGNPVVPQSIAHAPLMAGQNTNVVVDVPGGLVEGEDYVAMLHVEDNGNSTYDFGEDMTDVDVPVTAGGAPVTRLFTAGVEMTGDMDVNMDPALPDDSDVADEAGDEPGLDGVIEENFDTDAEAMTDDAMTEDAGSAMATMAPGITVAGGTISGSTLTVPSVVAEQDGYLVIHAVLDGEPVVPASIGHTPVMAGQNTDVEVTIDYPFVAGENYVAMLHVEDNGNSTYDFGEGMTEVDVPVTSNGAPVTATFAGGAM